MPRKTKQLLVDIAADTSNNFLKESAEDFARDFPDTISAFEATLCNAKPGTTTHTTVFTRINRSTDRLNHFIPLYLVLNPHC